MPTFTSRPGRRAAVAYLVALGLLAAAFTTGESGGADSTAAAAALPPFPDSAASAAPVGTASQAINADSLLAHIRDISADSMEGRAPGTPGEQRSVAYLTRQFQALGLQPGNPDGSWVQNVDLIGYTSGVVGPQRFGDLVLRGVASAERHEVRDDDGRGGANHARRETQTPPAPNPARRIAVGSGAGGEPAGRLSSF